MSNSQSEYRVCTCPACGHSIAVDFFNGGHQPLATLGWPATELEARQMKKLPLDFVRCVDCGHVYNRAFDYADVPYSKMPNRMFNSGQIWSEFLSATHRKILKNLPDAPTIVEIGYGDGGFLTALAHLNSAGRYLGFDPHGSAVSAAGVETFDILFDPTEHMQTLQPDILISRHVLEHLNNPLGFLQELSFSAALAGLRPMAYFEVPCIDNVLSSKRSVDFYYEHSSQFTTESFERMLHKSGATILELGHGYDNEVVYALVRMEDMVKQIRVSEEGRGFSVASDESKSTICAQLAELASAGKSIAIWGGTGKSAAFMCRYDMDSERFPIVVDSDAMKVGTHVPGTGQLIRSRDHLIENPADVLIIPPQWRAADIMNEIEKSGISTDAVLIEHGGKLIDFLCDEHIYARSAPDPGN